MWNPKPLTLNPTGTYTALCEIPEGIYKPPFDLTDKTVLDVGATCGEVAYYFITQCHAEKVLCVECDPASLPFLYKNASLMNIEVYAEPFKLEHLQNQKYDFIKCDVEGYEMLLLKYVKEGGVLPACVIEAHTNWIKDQFLKEGFTIAKVVNDTRVQVAVYMMNNYKKLGL